jgi:hypothetical protein
LLIWSDGAEIVHWISESTRLLSIVNDPRFQWLMKTGRPDLYIPSRSTVSCDVKLIFAKSHTWIAKILHNHPGKLSFATDTWTSPNHKAFIVVTVHLEN